MKVLFSVLVAALLLQNVWAAPTAPVTHSHAGRSHTHPLPAIGVGHRHGNGAPGVAAAPSGGGSISGSYTPGAAPGTASGISGSISGAYTPPPPASAVPPSPSAAQLAKGRNNCRRNDPDCNVCALNVVQQFNRAAAGQISWQTRSWDFDWKKAYAPQKVRPVDVFDGNKKYPLGIPDKHVQGFVRTNSGRYPFAGSHSHDLKGSIFLIGQDRQNLAALLKTGSGHPSGVQAFGQYLVYGESGRVYLKDLNHPARQDMSLKLPGPAANFGGGVGLIKLQDDTYLLVTTGPGGQDERPRYNRFYQLLGQNGRMEKIRYIGQSPQEKPAQWPAGFRFAENLSLVTECGSGDIYAIHATGDQNALGIIGGNGYWRLSRLQQQGQQLRLHPVSAFVNRQDLSGCSMRAAASVHVDPANRLEFYCHGFAKNPKGTTLNVLGTPVNRFRYTVGIPR
ncbi:MAG: hypothetical protein R3F02_19435 [Thiolinea sp.]